LWKGNSQIARVETDGEGRFSVEGLVEDSYNVLAFLDLNSTPGVDYLPSYVEDASADEVIFSLRPAASVILEGDIQFFESEELSRTTSYSVLDPDSGRELSGDGFPLLFGGVIEGKKDYLGLEEGHIIVPADTPVKIGVNSSVLVVSEILERYFEVDEPGHIVVPMGGLVAYDVRSYSIPFNIEIFEALLDEVEVRLEEMDSLGFYLTPQRRSTASATRLLSEASYFYDEARYIESFGAGKTGFIELRHTRAEMASMMRDASLSVYIIIALLAFSSSTIAFLLSNRDSTKALGSVAVFALSVATLHATYPGSATLPLGVFLGTSAAALLVALVIALVFPRFMKGRGGNGHVPVRNVLVPIFSIAKRGIRRRRLRFAFTLISITVLVMSFVTLTSFSEGYGLIVKRVSSRRGPVEGVLVRAQGYDQEEPVFLTLTDIYSGWLERQEESILSSPKFESRPQLKPLYSLLDYPITGALGIDPVKEAEMLGLEALLVAGGLPREGGVVLSKVLADELGASVGDTLPIGWLELRLDGVLDDGDLVGLRDIDGSSYLPGKIVNTNPGGEEPIFVYQTCEPFEVVFMHASQASEVPFMGITRVDLAVREGVDAGTFAERLALERGYWAWSSSEEGIHHARLGSYLEGKGLPLIVPWGIVVLSVVVTMLNSMYERRKEIHILSSVGLNPAQIAGIFVAEATIIGLTAGGLGYLAGLVLYKAMAVFQLALEVQQKVSAFWSLASIGISMTAVLMGALVALKSSVVITPSLTRRWRMDAEKVDFYEPWEIMIPVKLVPGEARAFFYFMVDKIRALEDSLTLATSFIKVFDMEGEPFRVEFVYKATQTSIGNFYTKNTLLVDREPIDGETSVRFKSFGEQSWSHETGSLVRMMAMRWSTSRERAGLARARASLSRSSPPFRPSSRRCGRSP